MASPNWGPTGEAVYTRTYSRPKPDGSHETWPETVSRVVKGNLALVYGEQETWSDAVKVECGELYHLIHDFKAIPAGRHLWMSGVPGRQYLFNCHVSGWSEVLSDHFVFTYLRLAEGGGVGANYSSEYVNQYTIHSAPEIHIVCDPEHRDYDELFSAGYLSTVYTSDGLGTVDVEDSREGWADAIDSVLTRAALDIGEPSGHPWEFPLRRGPLVFDVSRIRCRGARIKSFGGTASGPAPLAKLLLEIGAILTAHEGGSFTWHGAMDIDHAIAECVVSGNVRRSARMSIMKWDDQYILDFIDCKSDPSKHWTTNISVEIDSEFIRLCGKGINWINTGARTLGAMEVFQAIVTGMLTNGEPGLWNSELSNAGEPNRVTATNPCGEIALESWENCNLGHVNLDAFANDWQGAINAHRLMTRFLVRATFGDITSEEQAEVVRRNRRIGVGHFGGQGWLAKRNIRYSEAWTMPEVEEDLRVFRSTVREAARAYAFELRIPEPVKVTTAAPTGTIAKLAGRTEGWHPVYSRYFVRRVRYGMDDPKQAAELERLTALGHAVEDDIYSPRTRVVEFVTCDTLVAEVTAMGLDADHLVESVDEIGIGDLLATQAMIQLNYADNAVSFTANVPAEPHQVEAMATGAPIPPPTGERVNEFTTTLLRWLPYLKGTTVMVDGSRPQAPYERISKAEYDLANWTTVDDGFDENCVSGACPVK